MPAPTSQEILRQVQRITDSSPFANSQRMCRFLRFVVQQALKGSIEGLKEYAIGVEVFDRKPDYDPRVDPIVRVEARRLRTKLADYYNRYAAAGELAVELPKGSYVPRFGPASPAVAKSPAQDRKGIAVLPFLNASRAGEAEFPGDGLTLEIIHRLTQVPELRVVAWTSASHIRDAHQDLRQAGRALNVDFILTGSVRVAGERIRVLAQLVETQSGVYHWSQSYDRSVEDVLAIEQAISQSIVNALQLQLGMRSRPSRPEAYWSYLKGRYHLSRRTLEGLRLAADCFRESIELDPAFALPRAGLADAYMLMVDYGFAAPADMIERARYAAAEALRIDPATGEAENSLALISSLYDWEWDRAEQHYFRAMELSPSYAPAYHWYSIDYCALRERFEPARDALDTALQLDPLSPIIREGTAYLELLQRNFARALELYEDLLAFDPRFYKGYTSKGRVLMHLGDYDQAIEWLERGQTLAGGNLPSIVGALGQAHGMAGRHQQARACLAQLMRLSGETHVLSSSFALIHIGLGERGQALEWLRRGCELREPSVAALRVHPGYDAMRDESAFRALVDKIGA